jgi:hypothetical protein
VDPEKYNFAHWLYFLSTNSAQPWRGWTKSYWHQNSLCYVLKQKFCHFPNIYNRVGNSIVNIYDMVWKPFALGDCVPCTSRLKNPLSFYCLTIVSSESLAKGMGTKYLFLPGLYLTAYFANNREILPPFFDGVCLCYIVLID